MVRCGDGGHLEAAAGIEEGREVIGLGIRYNGYPKGFLETEISATQVSQRAILARYSRVLAQAKV
jgi:hypothetical protein